MGLLGPLEPASHITQQARLERRPPLPWRLCPRTCPLMAGELGRPGHRLCEQEASLSTAGATREHGAGACLDTNSSTSLGLAGRVPSATASHSEGWGPHTRALRPHQDPAGMPLSRAQSQGEVPDRVHRAGHSPASSTQRTCSRSRGALQRCFPLPWGNARLECCEQQSTARTQTTRNTSTRDSYKHPEHCGEADCASGAEPVSLTRSALWPGPIGAGCESVPWCWGLFLALHPQTWDRRFDDQVLSPSLTCASRMPHAVVG